MTRKKVALSAKPTDKPASVDDWVATPRSETEPVTPQAIAPKEKMKRLTLDIPESLHRAIKSKAVAEGMAMVDMLRDDLMQKYGNQ